MHMACAVWALGLQREPRACEIQAQFDVDYKTARKWRDALIELRNPNHPFHRLAATGSAPPSHETNTNDH